MTPTRVSVELHLFINRASWVSFLVIMLWTSCSAPPVSATAITNSSFELQSLTIAPANGSIMSSPTAQSFTQSQNSLGELVSNLDSGTTANSSAVVTWANASGTADSISQTASRGTSGPLSLQFAATLPYAQSLMTDIYGVEGTSEVIFNLTVDGSAVLFLDSPLVIAPSTSLGIRASPTLTNSMTLTAGQTCDFYMEIASESSGVNTTPELATLLLLLGNVQSGRPDGSLIAVPSGRFSC